MKVSYVDQKEYNDALALAQANVANRETIEAASNTEVKTTFALPTNISSVFVEQTEKALSVFDDYNNTLYKAFMESAVSK